VAVKAREAPQRQPHPASSAQLRGRSRPTLVYALAALGLLAVSWQAWSLTAWLIDGPHQVTVTQDTDSASWYAARILEPLAVVMFVVLAVYLVRDCRRQRRLTTDAKICAAGLLCAWMDPLINFVHPVFFWSSNFTNLTNWCGSTPLRINPVCGAMPEPILFVPMFWGGGILLYAIVANGAMRAVHHRWPTLTTGQLITGTFAVGCAFDLALETPIFLLKLQTMPGLNWSILSLGVAKFHLGEMVLASFIFTTVACLRYFRDDGGRPIPDQGLEHQTAPIATAASGFAWIGALTGIVAISILVYTFSGFYAHPYESMPAHLLNGICDTSGTSTSRYGPCPGDPEYHPPIRHLPSSRQ
jgi:hypothetical protein